MDALRAASPFDFAVGLGFDALAWRPRTHQLAYGTVPLYDGPGYQPSEDLRLVDADTLAKTTLFDFGEGGAFVFSPDGNQVALSTPEQIGLINADGSNFRPNLLSYPLVGTYSEYQYHPKPIWAADSASLRVAIPPADTLAYPSLMTSLWLIPVDGSPAVQIGNMPSISFDWPDNAFAPHLFQIAYVKQIGNATDEQYELHIATVDGSTDYVFTTGKGLHFIEWSPNGARFLYSANGDGNQGVFLGDGLGNIYTVSSISNVMAQMHWVDNSRFLYLYQNGGSWELRISDVDGTNHAFLDTFAERYVSYDFVK
jgi:Tol biopolymer transport system component